MRSRTLALNPSGKLNDWDVAARVNQILRGKTNNVNDITLTQSSTTTVINDPLITPLSHINLTALTANAALALAGWWVSSRGDGTATITHTLNANTDLQCTYDVVG